MCECGCVGNDERYTLPAPNGAIYVVSLHGGCIDCDSPPGVSIERIDKDNIIFNEWKRGEFSNGPLVLEKGAAIATGFRRHEFIAAVMKHLVGVSSEVMGENGLIDEAGADVIAEEMYDDAKFRPSLVPPVATKKARE